MKDDLKPLYIVGAGGFGREIIWLAETINEKKTEWDIKGFVDSDFALWGKKIDGYMVHGDLDYLEKLDSNTWCVIAVGNSKTRMKLVKRFEPYSHIRFATLIAPDVKIGINSYIGEGSMVCAGNIITVDTKIGKHNIVNLDCTIGHDVILDDYVTLYPSVNVSGCVRVGVSTEIGTGTQIIQGIHIGSGSIIGAGTTVIREVEDEVTVVGNPARIIKNHKSPDRMGGGGKIGRIESFEAADTVVSVWRRRAA